MRPYMLAAFFMRRRVKCGGNMSTQPTNRMAVSLFIGQGWRATSTLSPSDGQEVNAKGVAFSSDERFSNSR